MDIVIPAFAQNLFDNTTGSPIKKYPLEVLRQKAKPISKVTKDITSLSNRMLNAMDSNHGVGLAAPQVGESIRLVVIAAPNNKPQVVINPEIVYKSDQMEVGQEGCLSLPALYGDVERHRKVTVTGLNIKGKPIKLSLEEMGARIAQHEIDHLDGILFIDRAIPETLHWHIVENEDETDENDEFYTESAAR